MSDHTFVGTIGRDPELRYTAGGRAVTNFSIACSRRFQKDNEWQEVTTWFNVTCWADLAEHVAQSLAKGNRVIVTGRIEIREYEKDGAKRTSVDIVADEIGPSLRWANCSVERVEREKDGESNRNTRGRGQAPQQSSSYDRDEEPF